LRNWRRDFGRAEEVNATLPDGVLLLKALGAPLAGTLDPQAAFRLSQSRMQLQLDQQPSHRNLWAFSQCLLAEAGTLSLLQTASIPTPSTPLKLKVLDGDEKFHLVAAPPTRTKPILFQSDHANTSALMQVVVLAVPANCFTLGRMWMTRRPSAYFVEEKITERANVNCALGQRASKVSRLAQGEEEEIMVEAQLQLQMRQHQQSVAKRVLQLSKPPRTPTRRRLPLLQLLMMEVQQLGPRMM